MQNQSKREITFDTQLKTALTSSKLLYDGIPDNVTFFSYFREGVVRGSEL